MVKFVLLPRMEFVPPVRLISFPAKVMFPYLTLPVMKLLILAIFRLLIAVRLMLPPFPVFPVVTAEYELIPPVRLIFVPLMAIAPPFPALPIPVEEVELRVEMVMLPVLLKVMLPPLVLLKLLMLRFALSVRLITLLMLTLPLLVFNCNGSLMLMLELMLMLPVPLPMVIKLKPSAIAPRSVLVMSKINVFPESTLPICMA